MKSLVLTSLAGAGLFMIATFSPQTVMEKHAATLKNAKSLTATYSVRLSGAKTEYTLTYSKPNMIVVDGPDRLLESDGKTLWEYNKAAKTYTETPVTPALFTKKVQADELLAWSAFFAEDALKGMTNFTGGTSRKIKDATVTEVTVTVGGNTPRQITFYVDEKLGIARGIATKTEKGDLLVMADTMTVGADPLPGEKFAFAVPAGATKIAAPKPEEAAVAYASVQPILQNNCMGCHGGRGAKGGYSVSNYQSVIAGGKVVPGDPDGSPLVQYLTGDRQPQMPMGRGPLSDGEIDKIKAWIKAGAKE